MSNEDIRYSRVRCGTCGKTFQSIDFGCAAHVSFCKDPKRAVPAALAEGDAMAAARGAFPGIESQHVRAVYCNHAGRQQRLMSSPDYDVMYPDGDRAKQHRSAFGRECDDHDAVRMLADAGIAAANKTSVAQLIAADIRNAERAGIMLEPYVIY